MGSPCRCTMFTTAVGSQRTSICTIVIILLVPRNSLNGNSHSGLCSHNFLAEIDLISCIYGMVESEGKSVTQLIHCEPGQHQPRWQFGHRQQGQARALSLCCTGASWGAAAQAFDMQGHPRVSFLEAFFLQICLEERPFLQQRSVRQILHRWEARGSGHQKVTGRGHFLPTRQLPKTMVMRNMDVFPQPPLLTSLKNLNQTNNDQWISCISTRNKFGGSEKFPQTAYIETEGIQ